MRDTQDWKQKRMYDALTSCAEVVGGRNISDKQANFYLKELASVEWDLVKRAFNSFASRGRFPTVDDIRQFAGQKAHFDKPSDLGKTHEQKFKEEMDKYPNVSQVPIGEPIAIQLWAKGDNYSEAEAAECIKAQLKFIDRAWNVKRHLGFSPEIRIHRVTVHDSIAQGNKTIEQPRKRWVSNIIVVREEIILHKPALPPTDEF